MSYYVARGGLPPQTALTTDRARFTEAYAVLPARTLSDITTSYLPGWSNTRLWVIARPLSGVAETFSQYVVEMSPGAAGSHDAADEPDTESVLFVVEGTLRLAYAGEDHELVAGGYAYLPAGLDWTLTHVGRGVGEDTASFHWIRKSYVRAKGLDVPEAFVTSDAEVPMRPMPDTDGAWSTTRFVDMADLRHDMHVNIVTFEPGGAIPFPETHVMEHGLYVLEGKAVYLLNEDWVEVEAGDFMWLRAFCPQACYAGGPGRFRYLLYKDVNRHAELRLR